MSDVNRAVYQLQLTPGATYVTGPEGKMAQMEALSNDTDKPYRVIVNIVGKERQGKTSLKKMLIREPFDPKEVSTVGIDNDLVDIKGVSLTWKTVNLRDANSSEFELILGKHARKRLKKGSSKHFSVETVDVFLRIYLIAYFMMFFMLWSQSVKALQSYPWLSLVMVLTFLWAVQIFGSKEGLGFAIGLFDVVVLTEAMHRYRVHESLLSLQDSSCFVVAWITGALCTSIVHTISAIMVSSSFGIGMVIMFCICEPPLRDAGQPGIVLLDPVIYTFFTVALLAFFCTAVPKTLYVVLPVLMSSFFILPDGYLMIIACAIGCGQVHDISNKTGQYLYLSVINPIIKKLKSRRQKNYLMYALGLIPGYIYARFLGWQVSAHLPSHILASLSVVLCCEMIRALFDLPPTKASAANVLLSQPLSPKIVVRDFAGHQLYHSAHQLYMMGHSVYVVAFSLAEMKSCFSSCFKHILYWLQAIHVHARYPHVAVLLVGTHRDDPSITADDILNMGKELGDRIPRAFCNMLVWKGYESPLFPVENSVRNDKDCDHAFLRSTILKRVNEANDSVRYPIKYFRFFNLLEECRKQNILIANTSNTFKACKDLDFHINDYEDFENMLAFFHRCGEILYNEKDNVLKDIIVLDPQAVVTVLSALVTVPDFSDCHSDFIGDWRSLSKSGVCSADLLHHIITTRCESVIRFIDFTTLVRLLIDHDLICEIQMNVTESNIADPKIFYIIPSLLPKELPFPQNYWQESSRDFTMYLDFGVVRPSMVFLRLVCQCAPICDIYRSSNDDYTINVCESKALFTFESYSFKMELLGSEHSWHSQNLLKIVIRCNNCLGPMIFVDRICNMLQRIVQRDFVKCEYQIGILCPCESPHDFGSEDILHLLPLVREASSGSCNIPKTKEFWCRGRKVHFNEGRIKMSLNLRNDLGSSDIWQCRITEVPQSLYSHICDSLNLHNVLGKDWKGLAGLLNMSHRDVTLIEFRCPRDPCDALLQEWACRSGSTLERLLELMHELDREDIITDVHEKIS